MIALALYDYILYDSCKKVKHKEVVTVEKVSLSKQTTQRIFDRIVVEKAMAPGEKLPNELELSRQLGVSRTTLRDALRALITQGVLEVRRGKGTFVSGRVGEIDDFGFGALDDVKARLRDLFELRRIFEPQIARLACRRANDGELAEILARGTAVENCIRAGEDRTEADRAFHAAIVRATHNEFMMRLMPIISQAVGTAVVAGEHAEQLSEDTMRDHALLMDFLRKRDESGAEHAMAIHMHHSIDVMGLE